MAYNLFRPTKVGTSTLKLIGTGGTESALVAEVIMKVTATTPVVSFAPATSLHVRRITPADNEFEYSTSDESARIEPVSGDYMRKIVAGKEVYQITQGKSAVFKISTTLVPAKMFAGQYVAELKTLDAINFDGKYALLTIASDIVTNPVTIVGEKSPFITGVNNPIKANLSAIIEGVRFSPTENILLANGQQYKLKSAVNNKITFIPSEIGLPVGTYGFQIDSPQGKSNYGWLDIKEPTNAANVFTGFWQLITGWFKSKPKQTTPVVETVTPPNMDVSRVTVISPNGGEVLQEGGTYQIKWVTKNLPVDDSGYVALTKDGNIVSVLRAVALNASSEGSFSWTVPAGFVSENSPGRYEIKIYSADGTVSDYSDNQFTIYSSVGITDKIRVMSPNGGEKISFSGIIMAGDLGFKWKSKTSPTSSFYAAIINENGVLVRDTNRNSLSNLGGGLYASSFIGESKIEINKKYKIKVCDTISGYEVCDASDGYFIIE